MDQIACLGPAFRAARSHRTQAMRSNQFVSWLPIRAEARMGTCGRSGVWNGRTTPPCASRTRPSTRGYTGRNSGSPASAVSCRAAVGGGGKHSGRQSRRNGRSGSCPPSSCPARPPRTVGGQDDRLWPAARWARIVWRTGPVLCAGPSFIQRCANSMIRHRRPKKLRSKTSGGAG